MTHFDVSPDGSKLVYSACGHPTPPGEIDYEFSDDRNAWVLLQGDVYIPYEVAEIKRHHYEIVVSIIDGTDAKRLTQNEELDNFPVWSPDGSRIAFVSDRRPSGLYTMSPDGSDVRLVSDDASYNPPAWSPDGRRLAVVAWDGEVRIVYTVGSDGSGQARISETLSPPSWSPGGRRVALVAPEGDGAALHTFAPDGSDPVRVAGIVDDVPENAWIGSVSWSPDGSEILVGPLIVRLDGSEPLKLLPLMSGSRNLRSNLDSLRTSWSPDGSRIAVQAEQAEPRFNQEDFNPLLYTVDRDGTNPRVLVMDVITSDGKSRLTAWDPIRPPADIEACSRGEVVPDPEGSPGLVEDCRVLLGMRDTLSGSGVLDWSSDTPIAEWTGVEVDGEPLRVRGILLGYSDLYGQIPPEMGSLTELRTLVIDGNRLNGPIPPELGNLTNLEVLDLSGNQFTGSIPPELRDLANRD